MAELAMRRAALPRLKMPTTTSDEAYALQGFVGAPRTCRACRFESDGVVGDGVSLELATITCSVAGSLTAALTVAI